MSEDNRYDFSKIFNKVRPIHDRLTDDLIKNTPDEDVTQLIIDSIQFNSKNKSYGEIYAGLTSGQKIIYSIYILETKIFNGGFGGFYFNTECELNQFLEPNLIAIGAKSVADIVRRANEVCESILADQAEPDKFYPLDKEFYEVIEVDRLEARRVTYIREYREQFISA
ncbi:DUF4375 domain-containing protein [Fulvivirgaceae bacterium PWU5]|uniref:DUF4375 domain-containing protein n=1 Tax=Dawidia cretensis TaxID=2782350 RepID=A0AAP2E5F7_9BACT|nr:DUF4375 domain-containing protein [Dawidia cretensis]MBT1712192.1 DUF4375 domain-containing protein [Dawidia cretensis]